MNYNLTETELELLIDVLSGYLNDLRDEIRHTDNRSYKEELRLREKTLNTIMEKFRQKNESN
ncbi:MAG: hypothetical protein KJ963_05625 [Bacteroidetes bacterium]|jgi:ppGpp synthetase/RelA/SpoT-type nucleotidyltranferase|nr:hypothetical protein [Bacteroidota bacterium]MBU1422696.1 hypothetical protein [Bacteroidota bacterium]MBU2636549.1 hypothetical protein [Bacteroidota bacterium]MDI6780077.1 hypothetical protein [Bacteroidota bacterium]